MDAHAALDEWETSPFDGGLEEAARMAQRGFSGAIRSGTDWLFLADGDPVAVVSDLEGEPSVGDVDAFEDADGDAYEAPHPGVARLVPMVALGGEVRGQYFSDDTPIGTVQETLEDGAFTGYVELSENVLSGDYYVVFDEGDARYVAYIGSTEQLVTDQEAERKTKNEVGIYSVVAVDLPDVELPEPPSDAGPVGGVAADDGDGAGAGTGAVGTAGAGAAAGPGAATGGDADAGGETDASADSGAIEESDANADTGTDSDPGTGPTAPESGSAPADEREAVSGGDRSASDDESTADDRIADPVEADTADDGADEVGVDGASGAADTGSDVGVGAAGAEPVEAEPATERDAPSDEVVPSGDPETTGRADDVDGTASGAAPGASAGPTDDLRNELRELRSAVDRLETRVASLETGGEAGGAAAARTDGPSLSPAAALSKTTLFVREGTRGGPTLDDAHDGRADRDALGRNLDLEWHTRFDDAGATVDGQPYEAFLESSQAYEFVRWLTTELLFEIRVTDSVGGLSKLYDAIPEVDRVFFHESVSVDDGAETAELTFDVVIRDRNGAPLFVASLDDHRDPTPSSRIERLVTDASDVSAADASVVGAFAVTASYFEPEALEVAQEATTSSLLSRQKHRSYVNLTRKNGFHLCLVEARDAAFHLTLPEL